MDAASSPSEVLGAGAPNEQTQSQQCPLPVHSSDDKSKSKVSSSTLSACAPPFQSQHYHQSTAELSVFAKEFVPKSFQTTAPATTPLVDYSQLFPEAEPTSGYGEQCGESDPLLDYAFQVLSEITYSPGHFSHLCDQLVSTLKSWPTLDESVLQILIDEIISQAVREPNFRYNGARLCNAISHGLHAPGIPPFRTLLFNSCRLIHDERKNLMTSDAEYLRGFALFMSELFVHMSPKETPGRFGILGRVVRELLQTLLEHPTPGNVKCLCQILKLSGSYIEDDDRESHKGIAVDMDALMKNIEHVGRTVDMQMHMKDLLLNLIELRASDWGRAPSSPVAREHQQPHLPAPRMGVYYGPDGQALTAEETEFLNQGLNGQEEEFDYGEEEDTGMDDEMAEAFEKFLMMQDALK